MSTIFNRLFALCLKILCDTVATMENPISELRRLVSESTQKDVADQLGISQQYLSDVLNDRKAPGAKILDALGLQRVAMYVKKGKGK